MDLSETIRCWSATEKITPVPAHCVSWNDIIALTLHLDSLTSLHLPNVLRIAKPHLFKFYATLLIIRHIFTFSVCLSPPTSRRLPPKTNWLNCRQQSRKLLKTVPIKMPAFLHALISTQHKPSHHIMLPLILFSLFFKQVLFLSQLVLHLLRRHFSNNSLWCNLMFEPR